MRSVTISANRGTAVVSADRNAQVAVDSHGRDVIVQASGTGPRIGNARIGPGFGDPDGATIRLASRLLASVRLASLRLATTLALGAPRLVSLARIALASVFLAPRFFLRASMRTASAIVARASLRSPLAARSSLVPVLRPLARIQAGAAIAARSRPLARVQSSSGIGTAKLTTTPKLAGKDCSVNIPAACAGAGANRDGEDLTVNGSTPVVAYVGFDLSTYPAGATLQSATLTLRVKTAPLAAQTVEAREIANADESWSESGIVCGNRPAEGAMHQTFSSGTTAGVDINVALNAAWLTRLAARMGVGYCTVLLKNAAADLLQTVFESTDEGTDNALGPRLALAFTLP